MERNLFTTEYIGEALIVLLHSLHDSFLTMAKFFHGNMQTEVIVMYSALITVTLIYFLSGETFKNI